jgi:hypothetical protein
VKGKAQVVEGRSVGKTKLALLFFEKRVTRSATCLGRAGLSCAAARLPAAMQMNTETWACRRREVWRLARERGKKGIAKEFKKSEVDLPNPLTRL